MLIDKKIQEIYKHKSIKKIFLYFRLKYKKYSADIKSLELSSIWQAIKKYNPEKSSFITFLTVVHRNKVYSLLNSKKNDKLTFTEFDVESNCNDIKSYDDKEYIKYLFKFLTKREQYILYQIYWNKLTLQEIALQLDYTFQNIDKIHKSALIKLKKYDYRNIN